MDSRWDAVACDTFMCICDCSKDTVWLRRSVAAIANKDCRLWPCSKYLLKQAADLCQLHAELELDRLAYVGCLLLASSAVCMLTLPHISHISMCRSLYMEHVCVHRLLLASRKSRSSLHIPPIRGSLSLLQCK